MHFYLPTPPWGERGIPEMRQHRVIWIPLPTVSGRRDVHLTDTDKPEYSKRIADHERNGVYGSAMDLCTTSEPFETNKLFLIVQLFIFAR